MDITNGVFRRKKLIPDRLAPYGFEQKGGGYCYTAELPSSGFLMTVEINDVQEIAVAVADPASGEPYTLHLSDSAAGGFVGAVRSECRDILSDIAEKCFEPDVFKFAQTKRLISRVRESYGDELEFLWKKFDDNAIWRRKDNEKWYGAILTVSRRKLGLDSDEIAEIIDFRMPPEELDELVDGQRYFRGWHMNKKHWCTVILDDSVSDEELYERLETSYQLAK